MFDSGIKVKDLFEQIENEADIAIGIDDDVLLQSYNGLIRGLYRDIIQNEKMKEYDGEDIDANGVVTLDCDSEDVYRVYTKDFFELEKVNLTFALITSRMCWYVSGADTITLKNFDDDSCYVVNYEIPDKVGTIKSNGNSIIDPDPIVPVPIDFIDMVKAKIRGDMYNVANDDDLAGKWYGTYNARLEDFKLWITENKSEVMG